MKAAVFNIAGEEVGQVELPADVFGIEPNKAVLHQALVRQQANARQGTHATQTRGQVSRTTAKWFRQKGTGRARHGSRSANIFVGGAVSHGPQPRSYRKSMPRQMRRLALRSALSVKAAQSSIAVLDPSDLSEPRTRVMSDLVDSVCDGRSTLVLIGERNDALERSIRNLPHVRYLRAGYLNVRDLLAFDRLLIAEDALEAVTRHLSVESDDEGDDDDA